MKIMKFHFGSCLAAPDMLLIVGTALGYVINFKYYMQFYL